MTNGGCLPSVSRGKKWRLCVRKFCPPEVTQSKIFKKKMRQSREAKTIKTIKDIMSQNYRKKDSEVDANEPEADQAGMLPRVRTGISEKAQGGDTQSGC